MLIRKIIFVNIYSSKINYYSFNTNLLFDNHRGMLVKALYLPPLDKQIKVCKSLIKSIEFIQIEHSI